MSLRTTLTTLLRDAPDGATLTELASAADVPPTTARFHLDALVADGVVERDTAPPAGRGRPRAVYRTRRRMDPAGPRNYLALARSLMAALGDVPDAAERATRAGEKWGQELGDSGHDPVPVLLATFADAGFAPERVPAATDEHIRIALRHCPFLELAQADPQITCAVHRGLIRGVLRSCEKDPDTTVLLPFAGGDHCVAAVTAGDAP
ncbi:MULTISPECIES: helix-turn-helix transcriptional regulator [Gordonia]|uniref:Helix-turn-helix domain-containing protein n=1 Tax=Gordonia amicalis TaxID=89053 RepID=A0AAE4U7T9_9ACTN|nr:MULTISPECIES: helix-turn-helix domain-containing protein [Gordonia]ATD69927.1 transcriptional regulator [Gordonia sp. 1D]MDJ0453978.1 helix-turn-helix domain-containing protein [Gordonia amicalis]MDV6307004.1 helix-turn-helix domain-containing protein [Gordonia amicalis]MDV6311641.1 helix-turn-helix domain-containing protein [Gordonia amicalis]MDV7077124.1 helix-turn-helix domain-containing protein [Gordonia amicalis]